MTTPTTPCQACEKMREALNKITETAYDWIINGEGGFTDDLPNELQVIADAALALPCSCGTVNFDRFAQLLVKHGIIDECAIYDSEGYDGGKLLDHLRLAWSELQKGGDASCQPSMTPVGSTGAGQSNPEPAPTPRTDAALQRTASSFESYVLADFSRQLERELAEARERYLDLCRIVLPPAPQSWGDVREAELDEAAFEQWRTSKPASDEPITQYDLREAWRAALAYARGESK